MNALISNDLFLLIIGAVIGFLSTIAVEFIRNRFQKSQKRFDWDINNRDKREKQIHEFVSDGNPLAWLKLIYTNTSFDYQPLYIFDEVEQPVRETPKTLPVKAIRKYMLAQTQLIGRSEECEILLDDIDVSRLHALVRFENDNFRIYDLGSTKGTFVNQARVGDEGRDLNNGDKVQVGDSIFIFEVTKNVSKKQITRSNSRHLLPPLNLQEEFVGVVARVESLRGRMGESTRQVEGLFESLLNQSFT